jgi:hypothetical protein
MINIICWVSHIEDKFAHMSFDLIDNDYEKLFKFTERFERKRLSKTGFTLHITDAIAKELELLVSKKLTIKVNVKKYKFKVNNEFIEGCTFHYGGLV